MAKTDYITLVADKVRLYVYQSDILNSTAADPYVNVSVYLQYYRSTSAESGYQVGTWSAGLLSNAYTAARTSSTGYISDSWTGWKAVDTVFYSKGIWSVNKTRTSFNVSFSGYVMVGPQTLQYVSVNQSVSMQAWPVSGTKDTASIPSSMTMGSASTISITHKTTGNKNTLKWTFGSQSGTLLTTSTANSVSFTPATSLGAQVPSAMSGTITFTLTTYNSSNVSLGSTTYTSKLNVPAYSLTAPTVSAAKQSYATIGSYVANKTKTRFTLSGLPSGTYGATVTGSYVIKLGTTQQTSGTKTGTSSSTVDYTASAAGSLTLTYTIKDSRGKTASNSSSVTYVANKAPTIVFTAARDDDTPTTWIGEVSGTYLDVTGNTPTVTYSSGTASAPTASGGSYSGGSVTGTLAETSSLSVKATVTDTLGNTASKSVTISTVFAYIEATPNKVIAIGRKASTNESDRIEMGLPIYTDAVIEQMNGGRLRQYGTTGLLRGQLAYGDLYLYNTSGTVMFHADSAGRVYPLGSSDYINDFVVAQATTGSWYYRKWNSGLMELWHTGTFSRTTSQWTAWGNQYVATATAAQTFPNSTVWTAVPMEWATLHSSDGSGWLTNQGTDTTTTTSQRYEITRPNKPSATVTFYIHYYFQGFWK